MRKSRLLFVTGLLMAFVLVLSACAMPVTPPAPAAEEPVAEEPAVEEPAAEPPAEETMANDESAIAASSALSFAIPGVEDWDDIAFHTPQRDPLYPHAYSNSKGVAQVNIASNKGRSCTGFLVSKDLLMTADHCVRSENNNLLKKAPKFAIFGLERDVDTGGFIQLLEYC
jgi:hypothetical protein